MRPSDSLARSDGVGFAQSSAARLFSPQLVFRTRRSFMKVNSIATLFGSALALSLGVIVMPGCSSTTTTDGGTDGGGGTEGGGSEGGGEAGPTCPKDLKCATYCDFYSTTCAMNNGGVDK